VSRWVVGLWRYFDSEQEARAFLRTFPSDAGAELVEERPRAHTSTMSAEQRAIAALDRMLRNIERFERAWDTHNREPHLLWRSRLDRESWAGYSEHEWQRGSFAMKQLRDAIEALRIARTLLRMRLDDDERDDG
jgi:hypothetical protein